MPDRFGFDHLGDGVRCIDCPTGGPIWRWPEHRRNRHARKHHAPAPITTNPRRQRELLAAPPTDTNEESKEHTTMPTTSTTKGESTKAVTIELLRKAGEPLAAKEIAKRVITSGRCKGLKGKTPEATISAMLAVGSKPGGPFKRVAKGTFTLADDASDASEKAKPARRRGTKSAAADAHPRTRRAKPSGSTRA